MPRDDTKDEHIHVVVTEGQKARWSDLVEQNGKYDSLSDYMRTGAEKLYTSELQGGEVPDAVDTMRDEVMEELEEVASMLRLTHETLENVRENQLHEEMVDDIVEGYANGIEKQIERLNEGDDVETGEADE